MFESLVRQRQFEIFFYTLVPVDLAENRCVMLADLDFNLAGWLVRAEGDSHTLMYVCVVLGEWKANNLALLWVFVWTLATRD